MSLAPFLSAPLPIQVHAVAALGALALGGWQMLARKGTRHHRLAGWIWVALMALTALSSIGIASSRPQLGTFGWIHILSAVTLASLPVAVLHARRGRVERHGKRMSWLFFGGLVVAGAFTLLPGRIMHSVVFGG